MPEAAAPPRIYLAGPDIFFKDAEQIYRQLCGHCTTLGLEGLPPSDGGLAAGFTGSDAALARRIYDGNVALIRAADGVVANLAPFRGHEPDSGTVFEVGFAIALGKPVVGYGVPSGTYAERVAAALPCTPDADGTLRETDSGVMVEGLGQRINLMLSQSAALADSAEAAIARLAGLLRARTAAHA